MPASSQGRESAHFTIKILIAMLLGLVVGLAIRWLPFSEGARHVLVNDVLQTGGQIFINLIKMLVVPIVFVSLVCGSSSLGSMRKFARIGTKTIALYLLTTAIAITLALLIANLFHIGQGMNLTAPAAAMKAQSVSVKNIIINIFPSNPIKAMSEGYMLQIIVFAILFGVALAVSGEVGKRVSAVFQDFNDVLMKLIVMIMKIAPYGVFFLLAALFARIGIKLVGHLLGYFWVVLLVLFIQWIGTYSLMLRLIGRLNPIDFFRKMKTAMLFAFSVSSSNASIPIVLRTVETRLGVKNSIAAFIIPLGSTINMDGTSIMQGVATVFIAHAYNIHLGIIGYITVLLMATLASIGTAGVPSVGLITLAMVLEQVGLPMQGIALIIGIDRLLDMVRTAVNISGDAMIACLVGKSEQALDETIYRQVFKTNSKKQLNEG